MSSFAYRERSPISSQLFPIPMIQASSLMLGVTTGPIESTTFLSYLSVSSFVFTSHLHRVKLDSL
jgi:hypothetical protein